MRDDPSGPVHLSIIIPVHNEQRRLPGALRAIFEHLATCPWPAEVLVVDNGSTDRTFEVAASFARARPELRVLRVRRRGKGLAVRRGMLAARGEYRFCCDVDLSMPIAEVGRFLPPAAPEADVAIGSRELPDSVVTDTPARRLIGRCFNRLVRAVVVGGLRDTQCGFKCFSAAAAEDLFARTRIDGLAFDVEVLYLASRLGYRVAEVPITWQAHPDTRVRMWRDSLEMAADLFRVRLWGLAGAYGR